MSQRSLPARDVAVELLVEAGAVLSTSLDLTTTMEQVAHLTVPRLADLCVIDLREETGEIREVAVAAGDPSLASALVSWCITNTDARPASTAVRAGRSFAQRVKRKSTELTETGRMHLTCWFPPTHSCRWTMR